MEINNIGYKMKKPIMFDSPKNIPDLLGWCGKYLIFDTVYGNIGIECALMTAFGIDANNIIFNAVEMVQANMTKAQIINELKSALAESNKLDYFVSNYGTYTLFDTMISKVFECHEIYISEDFKSQATEIQFDRYVMDSISKMVFAQMESNYRPDIGSYWHEEAM